MKKSTIFTILKLTLPFILWLVLFREFLARESLINLDTICHYAVSKFFLDNLRNGVMPFWDPYLALGVPIHSLIISGFLSPLFSILTILTLAGVNFYTGYFIYLAASVFMGAAGFYFLARAILKDDFLAFIGYLLILFSGVTAGAFTQPNFFLMFVPAVWFCFFLVRFCEEFKVSYLLGLTLSTIILIVSYLPFHFATVLLVLGLVFVGFFLKTFLKVISGIAAFVKKNIAISLMCIVMVSLSIVPLYFYRDANNVNDIVTPNRQCIDKTVDECYLSVMKGESGLPYVETARNGTLGERINFQRPFSHLDRISYGRDGMFYLPLMTYILLLISLLTRFDRKLAFFLLSTVCVFIISMGESSGAGKMLYDHIFYFKYFRNGFFYMIFLMPLIVLTVLLQFKAFLEQNRSQARAGDIKKTIAVILFHLAILVFLWYQGNILWATYWTVLASAVFFMVYLKQNSGEIETILKYAMIFIILAEPALVFRFYSSNAAAFRCDLPTQRVPAHFFFSRPLVKERIFCPGERYARYIHNFWHDMKMTDNSGDIGFPYPGAVTRGVFSLFKYLPHETWMQYVSHKFYIYDHVDAFGETQEKLQTVRGVLENNSNIVFVSNPDAQLLNTFTGLFLSKDIVEASIRPFFSSGKGSIDFHRNVFSGRKVNKKGSAGTDSRVLLVQEPTDNFQVEHFDVNSIKLKTNFDTDKFLVYTDGFHSRWKLWINGEPRDLYRAFGAFKGIWLPRGSNAVEMRYCPLGGSWMYFVTAILIHGLLFLTIVSLIDERKKVR